MPDSIFTKWKKITAILGVNLILQILFYWMRLRVGDGGFYIFAALINIGLIYIFGLIILILILAVFVISGILFYRWINDSVKAKRLYSIILILLLFVQWTLGFTLIDWAFKYMWRVYFIKIFS